MEGAAWKGTGWNEALHLSSGPCSLALQGCCQASFSVEPRIWLLEPWVQDLALLRPGWVCSWA